ncbi:hypothetical protein AMECASPLE_029941 [Ameca splendens]|uniref:Uncharacterized protein n=1 Tax=Ameca splendens TaxID=208324 RepID=A0ABV0YSY7_9TELE
MFSCSPACLPSHALRLTRDTSQYQTSNRHPPMVTHFSSDDRITSFSSFTLTSNRQSPKVKKGVWGGHPLYSALQCRVKHPLVKAACSGSFYMPNRA